MIRSPASVISLTYDDVEDFCERTRLRQQSRVSRHLPIFADRTSACNTLQSSLSSLPIHSSQRQIAVSREKDPNVLSWQPSSERKPSVLSASKTDSYAALRGIQRKETNRVAKLYAEVQNARNSSTASISMSTSPREVPHKGYGDPQKSYAAPRLTRPDPSALRLSRHAVQNTRVPSSSSLDPAAPTFIPRIQIGFHASTKSSFVAWTKNQGENSLSNQTITVPPRMASRSSSMGSTSNFVAMSPSIVTDGGLTNRDPAQPVGRIRPNTRKVPVVRIDAADEFLEMRTSPLEELTQRFSRLPLAERTVEADSGCPASDHCRRPKLLTGDAFRANPARGLSGEMAVISGEADESLESDTEAMDDSSPDLDTNRRETLAI